MSEESGVVGPGSFVVRTFRGHPGREKTRMNSKVVIKVTTSEERTCRREGIVRNGLEGKDDDQESLEKQEDGETPR